MKIPKALVTGGTGFLGKHLIKLLKSEGIEVLAPTRDELNILNSEQVDKYFLEHKPEYVFHLAAAATQGGHIGDLREIVNINIMGTVNLLEGASQNFIKAFINVGSSSEYGSHKTEAMKETDLPEPDIYYSATKVATTMICRAISVEKALPVVTVRPFSVYGNGESEHRFIPTIIRNAKEGSTMNLAPGIHDWVYVEDVVKGMYIVAQHAIELSGQVVNLGTGRQMTNQEVVESISYCMDTGIKTNEVGLMRYWDFQKLWKADNTKAKSLGIQFRTFEQGIADMLKEQI